MRRQRPGDGFRCVWAFKNPSLHDFWVRANLGVYGRVTGQGVSRARACHGPGRVTDQGLVLVWSWFALGSCFGAFTAFYYFLPHLITFYYLLLAFTIFYYLLLLFITSYPFITFYYLLLLFTAFYNL